MPNEYDSNILDALRGEVLEIVEQKLSPRAKRYGYSDTSLESLIAWKPIVLILGNYSSGKSTLINELVGADIQSTGQAPTDDSFTVITGKDKASDTSGQTRQTYEVEQRDGKAVLNDPAYPFEKLKRHGERFSAHFKLKKVDCKLLENLAIVDTPGMLDSVSEQDRGYDYQKVIADFASIADLVLVLFDPHKAGTIRESHESLRQTLPAATYEDRVVFVLNRVDECGNLDDLLRVYGTLCWNLSQMTGRKDIPRILLSYSTQAVKIQSPNSGQPRSLNVLAGDGTAQQQFKYLELLENQRQKLVNIIKDAPKSRLDNMTSFMEMSALRVKWLIKGVFEVKRQLRTFTMVAGVWGAFFAIFGGVIAGLYTFYGKLFGELNELQYVVVGGVVTATVYLLWLFIFLRFLFPAKRKLLTEQLDSIIVTESQFESELWKHVEPFARKYLSTTKKIPSLNTLQKDIQTMDDIVQKKGAEIRGAVGKLGS